MRPLLQHLNAHTQLAGSAVWEMVSLDRLLLCNKSHLPTTTPHP